MCLYDIGVEATASPRHQARANAMSARTGNECGGAIIATPGDMLTLGR